MPLLRIALVGCLAVLSAMAQDDLIARTYDVSDLAVPIAEWTAPGLGHAGRDETSSAARGLNVGADDLSCFIQDHIDRGSWEGAREVRCTGSVLSVTAPAHAHDRIADLLAALRALVRCAVTLEVRWYEGPASAAEEILGSGSVLDAVRVAALDAAPWRRRRLARLAGYSGQCVHIGNTRRLAYVRDYDCEVAEDSQVYDPEIGFVSLGVVDEVRPILSATGRSVIVECNSGAADTEVPIATFETGLRGVDNDPQGPLGVPQVAMRRLRSAIWMPAGGQAIVGAARIGVDVRVVVVRHVVGRAPAPELPTGDGLRGPRIVDVRLAVHRPANWVAPSLAARLASEGSASADAKAADGSAATGDERRLEPDPDAAIDDDHSIDRLCEEIKRNVKPDSWESSDHRDDNQRCLLIPLSGQLCIYQSRDVVAKIDAYLRDVERARSVAVLVRCQVVRALTDDASAAVIDLAGEPIGPSQRAGLLERIASGRDFEVVSDLTTVALPGQHAFVADLLEHSYVCDYDCEIATKSNAMDPEIRMIRTGHLLEVCPTLEPAGGVSLALRIDASHLRELAVRTLTRGLKVQVPDVDSRIRSAHVVIPDRGTIIVDLGNQCFARIEAHVSRESATPEDAKVGPEPRPK